MNVFTKRRSKICIPIPLSPTGAVNVDKREFADIKFLADCARIFQKVQSDIPGDFTNKPYREFTSSLL